MLHNYSLHVSIFLIRSVRPTGNGQARDQFNSMGLARIYTNRYQLFNY